MNKIIRVLTFALLAAGLSAGSSEAKTAKLEIDAETKVVDSLSNAEVNFGVIGKQLTTMENQLKNGNSSSDSLSENVRFLSETRTRISNAKNSMNGNLNLFKNVLKRWAPNRRTAVRKLKPSPASAKSSTKKRLIKRGRWPKRIFFWPGLMNWTR